MPDTNYDFPIPVVNGQAITVQWLQANPVRIYRLLNTMVQRFLIGHRVLAGRRDLTGSGSAIYEISEAITADLSAAQVSPLAQYPLTTTTPGVLTALKLFKTGFDSMVSDEDQAHNEIDKVMRDLRKMANTLVLQRDGLIMAAVASQVTQTQAVSSGAWNTSSANPFLDVMLAKAAIIGQGKGYNPDTVVMTFTEFAYVVSRSVVLQGMPRETADNIIATGNMAQIAGVTYLATNTIQGGNPIVLDRSMLGSIAYEELGGNYQGSAAPPGAQDTDPASSGIQTKRWRTEENDGTRYRARFVQAPMIIEPGAACVLTGTGV